MSVLKHKPCSCRLSRAVQTRYGRDLLQIATGRFREAGESTATKDTAGGATHSGIAKHRRRTSTLSISLSSSSAIPIGQISATRAPLQQIPPRYMPLSDQSAHPAAGGRYIPRGAENRLVPIEANVSRPQAAVPDCRNRNELGLAKGLPTNALAIAGRCSDGQTNKRLSRTYPLVGTRLRESRNVQSSPYTTAVERHVLLLLLRDCARR